MVEALRAQGIPVAYLPFEGEQHGFRQAKISSAHWMASSTLFARVWI